MHIPKISIVAAGAVLGIILLTMGTSIINYNPNSDYQGNTSIINYNPLSEYEVEAAPLPLTDIEDYNSKEIVGDAKMKGYFKIEPLSVDTEIHCEFCTRVEYTGGPEGLAGIAYKFNKTFDLTGAKRVKFWVMGEKGNEEVRFVAGGKNIDINYKGPKNPKSVFKNQAFAAATNPIILEKDWKSYEIDISKSDLKRVTHPFGFEVKGKKGEKVVFYIKAITIDKNIADKPLLAQAGQ